MPKVSVLMPVHDGEAFLSEAVHSVLRQTFSDLELIVVDDGSTDGTLEVVGDLARQDRRIRVAALPHGGIVTALNAGLAIAGGEYVARMDADDIARADRLEQQVCFLDHYQDYVVCGCDQIFFGDRRWYARFPRSHDECVSLLALYPCIPHSGATIRRATLERFGISYRDSYCLAEDYRLWSELASRGKLANLPLPLVRYRIHGRQSGVQQAIAQHAVHSKIAADNLKLKGLHQIKAAQVHRFLWPADTGSMDRALYWHEGRRFLRRLWDINPGQSRWLRKRMVIAFLKNLLSIS